MVFKGLLHVLLHPKTSAVCPPLGMEVHHDALGVRAIAYGSDDVRRAVVLTSNEICIGQRVFYRRFVANVVLVPVPCSAGVGDVVHFVEFKVKIGLSNNAQILVRVFSPNVPVVKF